MEAQRGVSFSNIAVANKGKIAPNRLRMTVFDARADAATTKYASTM